MIAIEVLVVMDQVVSRMKRDWTGNSKSTFTTLGASNNSTIERAEHDYYATTPKAAHLLLEVMPQLSNIWECACGEKHLANVFESKGLLSRASDIINRCGNEVLDFLSSENSEWGGIS